MLLLIDAGNTRIKWAVVPLDAALGQWHQQGAAGRDEISRLKQDWTALGAGVVVTRACISNVAGQGLRDSLGQALQDSFGAGLEIAWFASAAQCAGVRNGYRQPTQLGCDRFAAAIGAQALFPGRELLVATCGTATTIDVLSAQGVFEGGMILPGLGTMASSLAQNTAQLPQITSLAPLQHDFADNTAEAIVAGCVAAQVGAIEHAVRARAQTLAGQPLLCLLAGGAGAVLAPHLALGDVKLEKVDNLVLTGLQVAAALPSR